LIDCKFFNTKIHEVFGIWTVEEVLKEVCNYKKNTLKVDNYYGHTLYKEHPWQINKSNNCKWFEQKVGG